MINFIHTFLIIALYMGYIALVADGLEYLGYRYIKSAFLRFIVYSILLACAIGSFGALTDYIFKTHWFG